MVIIKVFGTEECLDRQRVPWRKVVVAWRRCTHVLFVKVDVGRSHGAGI